LQLIKFYATRKIRLISHVSINCKREVDAELDECTIVVALIEVAVCVVQFAPSVAIVSLEGAVESVSDMDVQLK
jgi:hypothetical protein